MEYMRAKGPIAAAALICVMAGLLAGCKVAEEPKTVDPLEGYNIWFDKCGEPADYLTVVDIRESYGGLYDERLLDYYYERGAIKVLQGIVNREHPQIYMIYRYEDVLWLDNMIERGYIKGVEETFTNIEPLVEKFKDYLNGAVLIDEKLTFGSMIAMPVAACENLLPVSGALNASLGLEIVIDLNEMNFKNNAAGLGWAWDTYKDQLNQKLFIAMHPNLYTGVDGAIDYIVAQKGFPIWINEAVAEKVNGVNHEEEFRVVERIFKESPTMGKVMGFWWHGGGASAKGIGEIPGVRFTNQYGKVMLVCGFPNISVHCGIKKATLELPEPKKITTLEDKLYVSLVTTDGDALNAWSLTIPQHTFPDWFGSEAYGAVPMGWGMGVTMIDVAPAIAEWYWDRADENNEFFCDVSGLSYIDPKDFGKMLKKPEQDELWQEFFALTNEYVERNGYKAMRVLNRDHASLSFLELYESNVRGIHSFFADWGNTYYPRIEIKDSAYRIGEINVFRAMTDWTGGEDGLKREALAHQIIDLNNERKKTMNGGPAFAQAFVNIWYYYDDMDDMKYVFEEVSRATGGEVVFVTPSGLSSAYGLYLDR